MRTTLTIESDVEQVLLREMRRTDKSMKAVVNDALRVGLRMQGKPPRRRRFKVQAHAFAFKPGIDAGGSISSLMNWKWTSADDADLTRWSHG